MIDKEIETSMTKYIPMPICVINCQGKVIEASERISDVFLYDGILDSDIFALTGIKTSDLYASSESGNYPMIRRNDRVFKLVTNKIGEKQEAEETGTEQIPNAGSKFEAEEENHRKKHLEEIKEERDLAVFFCDVTNLEELKDRYNDEKPCIAKIQLDNYDQLIDSTGPVPRLALSSEIDQVIRKWAGRINASISRVKNSNYVVWFEQQYLDKIIASKFDLLDDVRNLETGTDFPASLSIGVGVGGKTMAQTEEYADAALDFALGRGGDQAVVKRNIKIEYFGGKLQTVEKSNKGKSRIVGHALKQLIEQSRKIFIMGHYNPDMDSFGSALGVNRLCTLSDREAYIVIDEYNESLQAIFKQAKESDVYNFISSEKAITLAEEDSLVIVVDTHRPSMVQCPKLLEICERKVVIDHHRKVEEFIENPVLAYMESYASSASELVAEILQFMISKKSLVKLEAEALLAGITVDTNGFAIKTGVRTFEASAWLRRQGADPTEVKRFFQEDFSNVKLKSESIAETKITENGIAISACRKIRSDAQLLCAQIADQLLTIKKIKASFVVGRNTENKTVISARSLGDVNVQVVMEKFGGGGHLTTAAAQVDEGISETIKKIMDIMEVHKNDSDSE